MAGRIWGDDEDFHVENQVRVLRCAEPEDERALLDTACALVSTPLPRTGPLWSAVFVTGLADGSVALVVVPHHVLADGVGGLARSGPPPIALLSRPFRPLAALGAHRWCMDHQHRMHTLVSHVRGPGEPITFAGRRIRSAVPVGAGAGGNMAVYFEVFTHAGVVTITAIADPVRFPDLDVLARALDDELGRVTEEPRR